MEDGHWGAVKTTTSRVNENEKRCKWLIPTTQLNVYFITIPVLMHCSVYVSYLLSLAASTLSTNRPFLHSPFPPNKLLARIEKADVKEGAVCWLFWIDSLLSPSYFCSTTASVCCGKLLHAVVRLTPSSRLHHSLIHLKSDQQQQSCW